ncbi:hypothetical protein BH10PSE19_BH10PSE19_09610 [soil metagenome]
MWMDILGYDCITNKKVLEMKKINKESAIKIFDELKNTNQRKRKDFFKLEFSELIIICAATLILIALGIFGIYYLYKVETLKTLMLILLLAAQTLIYIVWPVCSTFGAVKIIFNPFKFFLENIKEEFCHHELELISKLKKYKSSDLKRVAQRIKFECRKRQNFSKLILGPMRGIGLIPALLSTAFTFYQIYNGPPLNISSNFTTLINFISVGFVGLYFGNLTLTSVIARSKLYLFLIEQTISLKKINVKSGLSKRKAAASVARIER